MRRTIVLLFTLVFALAACGGQPQAAAPTDSPTASVPTSAPTAQPTSPVVLTFMDATSVPPPTPETGVMVTIPTALPAGVTEIKPGTVMMTPGSVLDMGNLVITATKELTGNVGVNMAAIDGFVQANQGLAAKMVLSLRGPETTPDLQVNKRGDDFLMVVELPVQTGDKLSLNLIYALAIDCWPHSTNQERQALALSFVKALAAGDYVAAPLDQSAAPTTPRATPDPRNSAG